MLNQPFQSSSWLKSAGIIKLGVILAIAVLFAVVWIGWFQKNEVSNNNQERAELYAKVLEEHALRTIELSNLAISSVSDLIASNENPDAAEARMFMDQAVFSMTFLRSMAWVDLHGKVVASTHSQAEGSTIPVAQLLTDDTINGTTIGRLTRGRHFMDLANPQGSSSAAEVYSLPILKPLQIKGQDAGLIVALVNPDFFENFQHLVLDHEAFAVGLFHYDGHLIAGTNMPGSPGEMLRRAPQMEGMLVERAQAFYLGQGYGPGEQMVAFRSSRSWPILTVVERRLTHVNQAWLKRMTWFFSVAFAVLIMIAILTRAAWKSAISKESAQRQVVSQLSFIEQLLETVPLPVYMVDTQGVLTLVNRAWEGFIGLRRESVLGRPISEFLSERDHANQVLRDRQVLETGEQVSYEWSVTLQSGESRDVILTKVPVPNDSGGGYRGVLGVAMDVTDFLVAERVTREAKDSAEQASKAKSEFIANISHELRTPLQSILGFSEIGQMRAEQQTKLSDMFREIHLSGQRMLALVNNLLDIAKIESAEQSYDIQSVNANLVIRKVCDELFPLIQGRGLEINDMFSRDTIMAQADPVRLHQVLINVMANAIKFSPEGGVITLIVEPHQAGVRLSVADQGCGIPPSELEQIFEPFVQSSETKDGSGGTGLGLAICKKIIQGMGGDIHASNQPSGGAVFHIDLPFAGILKY